MTDFPNLRSNFEHVIEDASLADIETMLRVIGQHLELRFNGAAMMALRAAEVLNEYRRGKRGPRTFARDPLPPNPFPVGLDEGGESG